MASKSMHLALCFFPFYGQNRNIAAYHTRLPVVLHLELQATGSKYPERYTHRAEHCIDSKDNAKKEVFYSNNLENLKKPQ